MNTRAKLSWTAVAAILVVTLFAFGCAIEGNTELSGTATKGIIDGGTVTAYVLGTDGSRGTELATAVTGSDGTFLLDLGTYTGPVAVVVTGGSYIDEMTGEEVEISNEEMQTLRASVQNGEQIAVTALTTIAAAHASAHASAGLATAIANADSAVAEAFGLTGIDIAEVIPADLTSPGAQNSAASKYAAVQAGLCATVQTLASNQSLVLATVRFMAQDFGDGEFDGQTAAGTAIAMDLPMPQQVHEGLSAGIEAFMNSERNRSGFGWDDLALDIPVATP